MKADIINPFMETVTDILLTMAEMNCQRQSVFLKHQANTPGDIVAVMPLQGDSFRGAFVLALEASTACNIGEKLLREPMTFPSDACLDMTGELANMVSGGARKRLWQQGYDFEMSQPTIELSQSFKGMPLNSTLVIPFKTPAGSLWVEVWLKSILPQAQLSFGKINRVS
ncbi:MAG: chemotaxis protein CheX [Saccharospirillum sp.]|uniref:chemotaxis protein CheX n=1 Tax=Saccharospirillum sp. TaxID=2033801 RepID=UPI003296B820